MSDDLSSLKVPPHSLEAEQSVLGGLLLDNSAWERVADVISAGDFYRADHRLVFEHISNLVEANKPADAITVIESLQRSNQLDAAGGSAYLGSLVANVPGSANIRAYAQLVRERSVMRQLAGVANRISDAAFNPAGRSAAELLDEAEKLVFDIAEMQSRGQQGFVGIDPLLQQVLERMEHLYARENHDEVTGVATGFADLDERTSGLQPGDLVIVAGRPSMGKAQPLDAPVRTPTGWRPIGDLALGDAVASVDGAPSIVTGVFPQGVKQVWRVRFADGRSAECCGEHLWQVHYRDWPAPRVLSTDRIRAMLACVRYRDRLWIEPHSGEFGHHEALPLDPWLLGALLGDGKLTGTSVLFSTASAQMLERVAQRLPALMDIHHANAYDYRLVRPGARGNPVKDALTGLGLWGLGSSRKFIPPLYLNANRAARLDLLRGLLDTDGWVERWGSVRFSTSSRQLADDVATLVRSLGGWCRINPKQPHFRGTDGTRKAGLPAWVCNIHHPDPSSLLLLSDKQTRLPQRWQRARRITFSSIEPSRMAECRCIAVSHPSHLYITSDDVVTHNTAFSLNIAEHVALQLKKPVAVFSMEMGATQLVMRMVGSVGRLDQHRVRNGRLGDEEWDRLSLALEKMNGAPLFIDESAALNPIELRARSRRLARQCGQLGLIVVDYLQLMTVSGQGENRATEISEISRSLKALAKELQVPVVALSQLNRGLEQRPNKRPVMSDLRESGAIEQDADVILFIYREEVYNPETSDKGLAEIIIGKQRNGPIGTVRLAFLGEHTRFENLAYRGDPRDD